MYRRKSLSNLILLGLEKTVDTSVRINNFINNPGFYALGDGWEYPLDKTALSKTIKRLREKGFIDFMDNEKLSIRLTDKGREKVILAKIFLGEDKWDGIWRIVIFDIPEKRRIARDLLRIKLKGWGFTAWQQSVWVTKKNCTELLRDYIKKIGIEDWVMVIESNNIGR